MVKTRVAFIINDFGLGGCQKLVVDYSNNLDKKLFETSVVTLLPPTAKNSFFKNELEDKIELKQFNFKGLFDFKEWLKLRRFLRQNKFDTVVTQLFLSDTLGRTAALFAGVKKIITIIQNLDPTISWKYRVTDKLLAKITDVCISPTEQISKFAEENVGFKKNKIVDFPTNSVDAGAHAKQNRNQAKKEISDEFKIDQDDPVIINIARLVEQKGQKFIIEAAPTVLQKFPKAKFIIVGDGALEKELKTLLGERGLEGSIIFAGARKDLPKLLAASDIFVFPSVWEGQGLILFEVIFSKTPIIGSDVGGIPDIIKDGQNGLLVEPKNPEELAEKIIYLLENADLSKRLAEQALEDYSYRDIKKTTAQLGNLLKR